MPNFCSDPHDAVFFHRLLLTSTKHPKTKRMMTQSNLNKEYKGHACTIRFHCSMGRDWILD